MSVHECILYFEFRISHFSFEFRILRSSHHITLLDSSDHRRDKNCQKCHSLCL